MVAADVKTEKIMLAAPSLRCKIDRFKTGLVSGTLVCAACPCTRPRLRIRLFAWTTLHERADYRRSVVHARVKQGTTPMPMRRVE